MVINDKTLIQSYKTHNKDKFILQTIFTTINTRILNVV